jgi:hypothetical protein
MWHSTWNSGTAHFQASWIWHDTLALNSGGRKWVAASGEVFPLHGFLSFFFSLHGCGDVIIAFGDGRGA